MADTPQTIELRAAVEDAYRIFATYSPGPIVATCRCPMCMDEGTERALLTTPLRAIDQKLLSEYTWSSGGQSEWPYDANEMRYFLPRYFDLISQGMNPCFTDDAIALRQLGRLEYRKHWPAIEISTIDKFFEKLLSTFLSQPIAWATKQTGETYPYSEVVDLFCMIENGGGDLPSLLDSWDRDQYLTASAHLAATLHDHFDFDLSTAFWPDERAADLVTFTDWLTRPSVRDRLSQAATSTSDTQLKALLSSFGIN